MDYSIETLPLEKLECDCLIIGVYLDQQLSASALTLSEPTQALINKVIQRGDIKGKVGDVQMLTTLPDGLAQRVLLVGLGDNKPLSSKEFIKVLQAAVAVLKHPAIKTVASTLTDVPVAAFDTVWQVRQTVEVFNDAVYQYTATKANKETDYKLEKLLFALSQDVSDAALLGLAQGRAIAEAVSFTKHLADLPGNICTPTFLAEQAQELVQHYPALALNVLEEAEMTELGMGAFLSVSRGSRQPAKLIALTYQGGELNSKPVVLIGKGLTFDAGGISLKPGLGMDEMKYDMCGGATVLGVLKAAAEMSLPLNIVGLVPASENLPDGDANKPGDIVTSMSGKTIEVLNTDAEGRLLLCDTLTYAERYHPDVVIDMATLTGACLVALGRIPSGLLSNDDELSQALVTASEAANDSVWRLPLWEEYQELLKSNFADMANIGGKDAGTITAACFLSRFAENYRWAHLDIAGTAWRTGVNKGATGRPVPLLCQYLLDKVASQHA
ncbi:leucyl aminopeptidase [Methylocucumis oryzae]|uniref:Probable cytosol aminopeptidase n=1 Tax=Methylocucumis oryzae TaxID=1632867 RepID=A0A0F3IJU2_9GAMM|nr:leucyl aminopeptidase [Methylocucumis oryzae]KJV06971.1 cytosol aminopeptidase [Methylocucumis oryzae]